eukprot:309023_1
MGELSDKNSTLPWVEKYRPAVLEDLVAHEDIISILTKFIDTNRLPHLLFYGPPGTGKTSTILACARRLYGSSMNSMVLELNASDDRGIAVVRNEVKEFAGSRRLFSTGVKLVILDEADAMTSDAQFALRRVIEKYTKNTRFCLICNYANKIIPALQSRCTKFRFAPLKPSQIEGRLQDVVNSEGVNMDNGGKAALLKLGGGDMRRVLNLLQSTHMAHGFVGENTTYLTAGAPLQSDVVLIQELLFSSSFPNAYSGLGSMAAEKGYALQDILTSIFERVIEMDLPGEVMSFLLNRLSGIEYRLAYGGSEGLNMGAFVGAFTAARSMIDAS